MTIKNNLNKKAQVTIFVILALILVVGIILIFLLIRGPTANVIDEENPQAFIDSCTRQAVEKAIETLSKQGGDINPKGSVMYYGKNITYLCYTSNFYVSCTTKRPMLIEHIEDEIIDYITPLINNCFQTLESSLENRYDIETEDMKLNVILYPKHLIIDIDKYFKMTRNDETREFSEFKINLINPIYDLSQIAMEIANQESHYCNFNTVGFMMIYPEYDLDKFRTGDSDIIYTVKERSSNQEFKFAIRSCVLPAGF